MNASIIAASLAIGLAGYLLVTDWVSLAPWNNVEDLPVRQKVLISVANYTPLLFIAFAITEPSRILAVLAIVVGVIDLLMHVAYWWVPYLRGASEAQKAEHAKLFGSTTTFLPAIGDHPIPNAQHVVVGVLMLAMVVTSVAVTIGLFGSGGPG
jgi:hypothetical protein